MTSLTSLLCHHVMKSPTPLVQFRLSLFYYAVTNPSYDFTSPSITSSIKSLLTSTKTLTLPTSTKTSLRYPFCRH